MTWHPPNVADSFSRAARSEHFYVLVPTRQPDNTPVQLLSHPWDCAACEQDRPLTRRHVDTQPNRLAVDRGAHVLSGTAEDVPDAIDRDDTAQRERVGVAWVLEDQRQNTVVDKVLAVDAGDAHSEDSARPELTGTERRMLAARPLPVVRASDDGVAALIDRVLRAAT